jgi:glycosyltransferase involved in cell wall biosynthesis
MSVDPPSSCARPRESVPGPTVRVLCVLLAPEPVPGPRYRVLQYLPVLERHGLRCDTMAVLSQVTALRSVSGAGASPLLRVWHWLRVVLETQLGCLRLLARLGRYDRVLLYRVAVPAWAAPLLRRRRRDLVYDYDDALDAGEGATLVERLRQRHLARSLARAVDICAAVCTSNLRNAAVIERLGGRAVVVPTSVDVAAFPPRRRANGPVVLGWMGTPSTAKYLPAIEPALVAVLAARPDVVVRLIGSGGNPFADLRPEILAWRQEEEIDQLLRFDVGLMPMPDTPWTRGKAALKALQYGAARAPTVASWTSTNEEILGGDSGAILCRTTEEWAAALLALVDDPPRRRALGDAAHAHVSRGYSIDVNGPRLAAVVSCPAGGAA